MPNALRQLANLREKSESDMIVLAAWAYSDEVYLVCLKHSSRGFYCHRYCYDQGWSLVVDHENCEAEKAIIWMGESKTNKPPPKLSTTDFIIGFLEELQIQFINPEDEKKWQEAIDKNWGWKPPGHEFTITQERKCDVTIPKGERRNSTETTGRIIASWRSVLSGVNIAAFSMESTDDLVIKMITGKDPGPKYSPLREITWHDDNLLTHSINLYDPNCYKSVAGYLRLPATI